MRGVALIPLLLLTPACGGRAEPDSAPRDEPPISTLWGEAGEAWTPAGRLPDFSHAGYGGGVEPPTVPVAADVRDFGAVGDGVTDDSAAFRAALDAVDEGAVWIPPGRYLLTEVVELDRSGLVLRGAGPDETTLYFPRTLRELRGIGPWGGPHGWSWGGGWIWGLGSFEEKPALASVTAVARRGDSSLELSTTAGLEPGLLVRLAQHESDGSLTRHLHNGNPLEGRCLVDQPGFRIIDWVFRIHRLEGTRIHLDRPLRVDVRPEWQPEILPFAPTVSEIGVEGLTVEFPRVEYPGHHKEPGQNGIYFFEVHNGWVRDVAVKNFDNGISFWNSTYSTATGLRLHGRAGHYGLNLGASQDCWMTDFSVENQSVHDLSVSNLGNGNVFSNGRGVGINFDHHRGAAYENLFSNIDVGKSWRRWRLWDSSGTPSGHYTAARETFWNIQPRVSTKWIPAWPQLTIVGEVRDRETLTEPLADLWIEPTRKLEPADLHAAQRRLRGLSSEETPGS